MIVLAIHRARRDFDLTELAGSWSPEEAEEFDAAVQAFEEIDSEVWEDPPED